MSISGYTHVLLVASTVSYHLTVCCCEVITITDR